MSDSDETICDDGEDQMSPSIIAPIHRKDSLDSKTTLDSEITANSGGSPEFLPPSAKIQRLAKEKTCLAGESAKTRVYQEPQRSQIDATFNTEKPAEERLKLIKEQEGKIEELLVLLESNVKRGASLKESPIFAQAKLLMIQVKNQLADFTRYQQQQRQQIANESQDTQDDSESQCSYEIKQRILELATQQKELLRCFQCHKKLLEKIQALKQKANKSVTKHILPGVEEHHKSCDRSNKQVTDKSTYSQLQSNCTVSTSVSKQGDEQPVSRFTPLSSSLKHVPSHAMHLKDSYQLSTVNSSASQVMPSGGQVQLQLASIGCASTPILCSVTQTQSSVTPAVTPQTRVQDVTLTAGQLYQVGDRQVYVLPQGLATSVTSSAMTQATQPQGLITQATQPQQVTTSKVPSYTPTPVATKVPVMTSRASMPGVSMAKSTQKCTLNTVSTSLSCTEQTAQPFLQLSSCNTQVPSTDVTLPVSNTTSLRNSSTLPVSNNRLLSASSTLQQNTTFFAASQFCGQGSKQMSHAINSTNISSGTNENTTASQKSARVQPQYTTASQNTAGVQSLIQATKTTTSVASKAPAVQFKSNQSLQRRNSFGSELPDMKSLLSHNVIEAGSNVLSIQFEGRNFEASLRASGLIESAGGETFRTPMAWMRAVTGSWNTVKQSQAYKMVHYKGTSLALFTIPSAEKGPCEYRGTPNGPRTADIAQDQQDKTGKENGLITSWDDVAQLLTNCRVMPIGSEELFPTDSFLPVNFWDSASEVDIPQHILEEVDF